KEFLEINDQDAYGTITIPDSGYNENRALNRKGIRCLLAGMFPTVPINSNNIGNFIFWNLGYWDDEDKMVADLLSKDFRVEAIAVIISMSFSGLIHGMSPSVASEIMCILSEFYPGVHKTFLQIKDRSGILSCAIFFSQTKMKILETKTGEIEDVPNSSYLYVKFHPFGRKDFNLFLLNTEGAHFKDEDFPNFFGRFGFTVDQYGRLTAPTEDEFSNFIIKIDRNLPDIELADRIPLNSISYVVPYNLRDALEPDLVEEYDRLLEEERVPDFENFCKTCFLRLFDQDQTQRNTSEFIYTDIDTVSEDLITKDQKYFNVNYLVEYPIFVLRIFKGWGEK
ncbi:MAG TPA: hypothetical protein PLJ29_19260, partial [Leptospiraceae bacterium]|nr:hypothetical protein [Leptospiraceae bacterium]